MLGSFSPLKLGSFHFIRSKISQKHLREGGSDTKSYGNDLQEHKISSKNRRKKVSLKGLENAKLLATLDILNPKTQEGLNKIFSSKFKQPLREAKVAALRPFPSLLMAKSATSAAVYSVMDAAPSKPISTNDKRRKSARGLNSVIPYAPLLLIPIIDVLSRSLNCLTRKVLPLTSVLMAPMWP
ncbi:hypothetical protein M9H77_35708 [Catharanthus roseus]|uniref:Uncharacterized protein n=1 Tax=Catharanthus roseus TaxID=4058 RepID=A0ACB9ZRP1_CATRO|nr:hypothetical protein M9H77_35708 [Catharanthus roseus]